MRTPPGAEPNAGGRHADAGTGVPSDSSGGQRPRGVQGSAVPGGVAHPAWRTSRRSRPWLLVRIPPSFSLELKRSPASTPPERRPGQGQTKHVLAKGNMPPPSESLIPVSTGRARGAVDEDTVPEDPPRTNQPITPDGKRPCPRPPNASPRVVQTSCALEEKSTLTTSLAPPQAAAIDTPPV